MPVDESSEDSRGTLLRKSPRTGVYEPVEDDNSDDTAANTSRDDGGEKEK